MSSGRTRTVVASARARARAGKRVADDDGRVLERSRSGTGPAGGRRPGRRRRNPPRRPARPCRSRNPREAPGSAPRAAGSRGPREGPGGTPRRCGRRRLRRPLEQRRVLLADAFDLLAGLGEDEVARPGPGQDLVLDADRGRPPGRSCAGAVPRGRAGRRAPRRGSSVRMNTRCVARADAVDAAVALHEPHRVPGQVVVDDVPGLLEVDALGEDVGRSRGCRSGPRRGPEAPRWRPARTPTPRSCVRSSRARRRPRPRRPGPDRRRAAGPSPTWSSRNPLTQATVSAK